MAANNYTYMVELDCSHCQATGHGIAVPVDEAAWEATELGAR